MHGIKEQFKKLLQKVKFDEENIIGLLPVHENWKLVKKKIIVKIAENKYNRLLPVHGNWKLVKKKDYCENC